MQFFQFCNVKWAIALCFAMSLFACDVADSNKSTNKNDISNDSHSSQIKLKANLMNENKKVLLKTSMGDITILLDADKAPNTVANFLEYVESGFYNGTIFHRVIDGFMIQGGGFEVGMKTKETGRPIKNEADNGLSNEIMTIAMARTNDPHSATAQFFINVADNKALNYKNSSAQGWGYAVFGKVIGGMDVVKKIKSVDTKKIGYHSDVPTKDVVIKEAKVLENS